MAEVYLATDTVKQVDVALKLLRPDLALDPTFEEYFRREARVMQQLQHPNIVRFYEPMRDGELLFLVLDFIDGPNLQKYLFTHKLLEIADALHIAQALATALDYAHASGVIHRDLKPSNVLLAFNGAILLSDFGVARVAGATTTTTGMVGSPAYMAPEQIQGAILTRAADQYSLAVLLWELIASRRPFVGASAGLTGATLGERVLEEHLSHPPPTGVLPEDLDAPLRKALAKNASNRFPSCTALVQQLVAGSATAPTTPQEWQRKILPTHLPPPLPPQPLPPDWARRLQTALGGLFAFLRTNKLVAGVAIITLAIFSLTYTATFNPKSPPATIAPNAPQTESAAATAVSRAAQIEAANSTSTLQASNQRNTEVAFAERAIAAELAAAKATSKAAKTQAAIAVSTLSAANSRSTESAATQRSEEATRNAPTKRPIFVLPSSTPRIPDTPFPPAAPAQIELNSMTWEIIDLCNDGLNIWFKFFDRDSGSFWPPNNSWSTISYGKPAIQNLACTNGTWVCYGAQPSNADGYWGVGLQGDEGCENCCSKCEPSTTSRELTCSE